MVPGVAYSNTAAMALESLPLSLIVELLLLQADKIATGHNADDIAETVLLNILRGDLPRLSRCAAIITGMILPLGLGTDRLRALGAQHYPFPRPSQTPPPPYSPTPSHTLFFPPLLVVILLADHPLVSQNAGSSFGTALQSLRDFSSVTPLCLSLDRSRLDSTAELSLWELVKIASSCKAALVYVQARMASCPG